jgi:predicted transcriptional regulator
MSKLVRDIMKIGVPVCKRDTRLPQVARIMALENSDAVIVMDEFGACGVITQTDLVASYPRNYDLINAEQVMTEKIIEVAPESSIAAAANLMNEDKVHQLFLMHTHPGPSRPSAVITMRAIVREMAGMEPEKVLNRKDAKNAKEKAL